MKKKFLSMALACTMIVSLGACGGNANSSSVNDTSAVNTEEDAANSADGETGGDSTGTESSGDILQKSLGGHSQHLLKIQLKRHQEPMSRLL